MIPLAKKQPQIDPLLLKIIALKERIDREECRLDCATLIERHVKIEDKDVPGGVIPFQLWPEQRQALADFFQYRLIDVYKTRQCGLTWLVLSYIAWHLVYNPAYSAKALSAKEDPDAKELVRRLEFILRHLPPHIIQPKKGRDPKWGGPVWDSTALTVTVFHPGAEDAAFQSLSAAPNSGRMLTGNLLFIDEWAFQEFARDIWAAAFPTVNRPTGGQVIGVSTMKIGTLFDEISKGAETNTQDGIGENGFHEIFLDRWADPKRDQAWFERTKRAFPNSWRQEYPETPEEGRSVGEDAFFLEWQESIHVPIDHWAPPRSAAWPIIGVYDPAYNQACFKWYTVSPGAPGFPRGHARCFREYTPVHVTAYDQAREILRLSCYRDGREAKVKDPYPTGDQKSEVEIPGTPYVFQYIVGDTRAWVKGDDSGISTAEIFAKYGLFMRQASKSLDAGWMELHEWLKPIPDLDAPPEPDGSPRLTAKLTFTKDCRMTRNTYPACIPSKSNGEDISDKTPHDPQDCDRYFVMSRAEPYVPDTSKRAEVEAKWAGRPENEVELIMWRKYVEEEENRGKGGVGFEELGM